MGVERTEKVFMFIEKSSVMNAFVFKHFINILQR